jgi:pSer/pThr/pTyr-binding forkhead associated (FHA) protein
MNHNEKTSARPVPVLPAGAPRIRLTAGRNPTATTIETSQPVTLIGSRRDCDLFIGQSDVSKVHCALVNTGTAIIVADLCGRAGTFLNGREIAVATLCPGDELRVGSEPIGVQFLDPPGTSSLRACDNERGVALRIPLRLTGAQESCVLTTLPGVIGRRSACQVLLDTPDVSLAHALLFAIEGRPVICDLGSRSGTLLNGERVALAWLRHGDRLTIGGEDLSLSCGGSESAQPEPDSADGITAPGAGPKAATPVFPLEAGGQVQTQDQGLDPRLSDLHMIASERFSALERRQAVLRQREAALDEREAKLAAAERELARKRAELAQRETADTEAAKRIAQLVGVLSEAWQVFGFGEPPTLSGTEPNRLSAAPAEPGAALSGAAHGDASGLLARADLPAPLVDKALFPTLPGLG